MSLMNHGQSPHLLLVIFIDLVLHYQHVTGFLQLFYRLSVICLQHSHRFLSVCKDRKSMSASVVEVIMISQRACSPVTRSLPVMVLP